MQLDDSVCKLQCPSVLGSMCAIARDQEPCGLKTSDQNISLELQIQYFFIDLTVIWVLKRFFFIFLLGVGL